MIPLPSGKLAGISNIRARYHALRLNRVVEANTSHRDLYGFVDIVIKPERLKSIPYQPSFLFSGHTLADISQLSWPASDRNAFSDWIQQEHQIREIDQVRKRLSADESAVTEKEYGYPDRLYSCLQNRLELLSMHRASPQQWLRTLTNMTRSGIREEELTWSGLLTYLEKMKQEDVLQTILADVEKTHPVLRDILIDERDKYLAQKIKTAQGNNIVCRLVRYL